MNINIGEKIRELRKKNNITLEKLAEATGLSYSFLSNLENGKHSITITNLSKLARFFNVDMVYFFSQDYLKNQPVFVKKGEGDYLTADNVLFRVLTPDKGKLFRLIFAEITEDSEYISEEHSHAAGEEQVFVISGIVRITVEGQEYLLKEGDSLFYRSELNHEFQAIEKPVRMVIVLSHF